MTVQVQNGPETMFPARVTIAGVTIKLLANGTWEGDRNALLEAAAKCPGPGGSDAVVIWLLLNAAAR